MEKRLASVNISAEGGTTDCSGASFLKPITLSHLVKWQEYVPLADLLARFSSDKKRIAYLNDATAEYTGLREFLQYLTLLLRWMCCF